MIFRLTKFQVPSSYIVLVIAINPQAVDNIHTGAILLLCILQNFYFKKVVSVSFQS